MIPNQANQSNVSLLHTFNVSSFGGASNELLNESKKKLEIEHNIELAALRSNYEKQIAECTKQYQFIKRCLDHELETRRQSHPPIVQKQQWFAANHTNTDTDTLSSHLLPPITLKLPLLPNSMDFAVGINNNNYNTKDSSSINPQNTLLTSNVLSQQSPIIQIQQTNSCINDTDNIQKDRTIQQTVHNSIPPEAEPDDEALVIQILAEMRQKNMHCYNNNMDNVQVTDINNNNNNGQLDTTHTTDNQWKAIKKEESKFKLDFNLLPMIRLNVKEEKKMKKGIKRVKKEGIIHKCDYSECGYNTTNQAHLRKHIRTHTDERPFQCNICQKAFKQKSNLKTHLRIHTGQRPFECGVCHKTFTQRSSLVQHEKIHSGEKPFVCLWPECGKQFKRKDHLKSHQRVHTGEKPEKCGWHQCDKRFATPQQLRLHMMDHTGMRPYVCDHGRCGKSFKTKSLLSRHKDTHLEIKPYSCSVCGKGFTRKSHFNKHLREKHNKNDGGKQRNNESIGELESKDAVQTIPELETDQLQSEIPLQTSDQLATAILLPNIHDLPPSL